MLVWGMGEEWVGSDVYSLGGSFAILWWTSAGLLVGRVLGRGMFGDIGLGAREGTEGCWVEVSVDLGEGGGGGWAQGGVTSVMTMSEVGGAGGFWGLIWPVRVRLWAGIVMVGAACVCDVCWVVGGGEVQVASRLA